MDLRQLEYVVAVADRGTFTAAAVAVHVAQPSLSQAVRAFERELGAVLFERAGRGVRLTAAGESVVASARVVLRSVEDLKSAAVSVLGVLAGYLDLVSLPTLAVGTVAPLVAAFRQAHPGVLVNLRQPDDVVDLVEFVRSGRADIGVTELPAPVTGLVQIPLADQELVAVSPPGSRASGRRPLTIAQLAKLPLVLPPPGTSTRRLVEEACRAAGVVARVAVQTEQREALTALVIAGAGTTVLPAPAAAMAARAGAVIARLKPPIVRRIGLIHRPAPLAPAAQAFMALTGATHQ